MSDPISTAVSGFGTDITTAIPLIAAAAVPVAALLWGIPKGVSFFKRTAK